MLDKIRDRLQLDRTLGFALAARIWQTFSGPVTIILLIKSLSLPEQGVYYAIVGIVGVQAYFELGLLNVLVSHASHETVIMSRHTAVIELLANDQCSTQTENDWSRSAARMRDLIGSSMRWFSSASFLYAIAAILFGWITLSGSAVSWKGPLIAVIPMAAIGMALSPALSILEGAGYRDLIYRFRLYQMAFGSICVWAALATGMKIWALVVASTVQAVLALYVVLVSKRDYFQKFRIRSLPASDFNWIRDVLPLQWRVALIGAAFHFATQFFTIIVIMFHSDVEAAPLGMTLSITGSIQMLALAWVQTKYPIVAALHGAGDREKAGTLWRRTAVVSTGLLIFASLTLIVIVLVLPFFGRGLENRFILPWQAALLSIGSIANHITALQGFYVLSRRAKPLLAASLVGAAATGFAVWIAGYLYSTSGVVTGYATAMSLIFLPIHSFAYAEFRKRRDSV